MKRLGFYLGLSALLVIGLTFFAKGAGRFGQRLPVEKQPINVLNRLTFGARPGDVDQMKRLGVDKWIDQQLHPDRIPESPVLESKLKPLSTLQLPMWQILDKYSVLPPGAI